MISVISEGFRKARKAHRCDAWPFLSDAKADLPEIESCKGIKSGDEYYYQVNDYDGINTFKSCKGCLQQSEDYGITLNEYF